jgi:hypothetical protein
MLVISRNIKRNRKKRNKRKKKRRGTWQVWDRRRRVKIISQLMRV